MLGHPRFYCCRRYRSLGVAVDHPTGASSKLVLLDLTITFSLIRPPHSQMWDADDGDTDVHATAARSSESHRFSFDDAFSEDDGALDATLEFNPTAIRAALARTLAVGDFESTESHDGVEGDRGSTDAGASDLNHDRNGSVKVEDPDASVSTLDINASPARAPGRAPGEWSRSTSYSHGYGYRQDTQDSTGVGSLAGFSMISLSDSANDLESVEISSDLSEDKVEEDEDREVLVAEEVDESLFRAVHIDLSQGGKPRVEELMAAFPEPSVPYTPDRDEAQTPSPRSLLSPSLPSGPNDNHNIYAPPPTSTPTSNTFQNHQTQSRSVPDLPPQTTHRRSAGDAYAHGENHRTPPDSSNTVFSSGSPGHASSATTSGSTPTHSSTTSPPISSQSESPKHGGHRHTRSVGPSTLDKVISRTRPTFLPPKPKTEDLKHLADWETMMKQSRAVGKFHSHPFAWSLCWFRSRFEGMQAY